MLKSFGKHQHRGPTHRQSIVGVDGMEEEEEVEEEKGEKERKGKEKGRLDKR